MKAFVERLCDHAGIVRAGPQCQKYGDPFDFSAVYVIEDDGIVIKALVTKNSDKRLATAHARAAFRVIRIAHPELTPTWERIK